jgi:hypothetical protein
MSQLRRLIWVYLWLLIFEGALRKWVVPALDTPLLIIRDPLVLWIYAEALRNRLSFQNVFFIPNFVLAVGTVVTSMLFGQGNLFVTFYGFRTDFLQVPLIFLIPQIMNRNDVVAMGKFILYLFIPITALVVLQFRSPVDSWVNKNAFRTHYGTVRPSATFSFIPGLVSFVAMTSSYVFYGFLQSRTYKIWLLAAVTFCLLLASACSGSRSCLLSIGLVATAAIICVLLRGKGGAGIVVAAGLVALLFPLLSSMDVFKEGTSQLDQRFEDTAAMGEDSSGMLARYVNTMLRPLSDSFNEPLFGRGLGLGTNAAVGLLGNDDFVVEDDWGRMVLESGALFGLPLCLFRIALTIYIARSAYLALCRDNVLPALIFASCAILLLNGQWGVPTILGFAILGGGLTLAACVVPEEDEEWEHEEGEHHHEEHEGHAGDGSDHSTPAGTTS